jgi:hypothetical protein
MGEMRPEFVVEEADMKLYAPQMVTRDDLVVGEAAGLRPDRPHPAATPLFLPRMRGHGSRNC